jgi:rRNA pseudouridine-1189 N-methylase Emg1 (Nep1/Mra1 family)
MVLYTIKYNKRTIYVDYIACVFIYINIFNINPKNYMKCIGILSHLVETGIGGKGKGLLLVETC